MKVEMGRMVHCCGDSEMEYLQSRNKDLKTDLPIIAVDLDGSLIKTDSLYESVVQLLRNSPITILQLFFWLLKGKARLKAEVAKRVSLNPLTLPYNQELITWLKDQKTMGRKVILCTASDQLIAQSIADHLGMFDAVIASDGKTNVAGSNKRLVLQQAFGERGYDYVGNSASDIEVWYGACKAIVVNARGSILKKVHTVAEVSKVIPPVPRSATHWRKVFRVHQWLKNLLLFVPLFAAHQIGNTHALQTLLLAFISFSACASAVYITNDLLDLEIDRQHPRKRHRPFASGAVPIAYGVFLAPLLGIVSLILSLAVGPVFFSWLITYFILTTAYSISLKRFVLIDCLTLTGLYTMRIIIGGAVVDIPISFWLLAFSTFIFLSLAFVKRYAELQLQAAHGNTSAKGRGYHISDAPLIQTFGITAGYASVLVLALYINSESVVSLYDKPQIIWMVIPLMLFWISWVWMKAQRGQMHDDPIVFAIKDRGSLFVGLLLAIIFSVASRWSII